MSTKEKTSEDFGVAGDAKKGLTTEQAEKLAEEVGYNELPVVEIPLWWVLCQQFMGTMPYMLELAIIISAAVEDWIDFGIILAMLFCNGLIGFVEELKAAAALSELTSKMEKKIACLRDGKAENILTRLLVPGDVVLLLGGAEVPADIEWLEGDVLEIDTAALTGEPLPRKYPSDEYGKLILCGATVKAGEAYGIVRATGINTEIGGAQADIMQDKATTKVSVFEERVLFAVKCIILVALIDVFVVFFVQGFGPPDNFRSAGGFKDVLLACLSIIIAAVPVALPLVLQVTMSLGAAKMAKVYDSVVTSIPALQDISSMTVLCSDKTGTLTTAKITIHAESVWLNAGFTANDLALYAGLASSRDKKDDAIDRSVIGYLDKLFGQETAIKMGEEYTKTRSVGFNPIYKRVLFEFSHPVHGKVTVAKGLPNKILDTADGGVDDAADQWKCEGFETLKDEIKKVDLDFSKAGYKTLGVAAKVGDAPWKYVGILPMLDPPRHDTAQTIKNLNNAGIEVKMITGDHLNIAIETARLIGLGRNIHAGSETREANSVRDELVKESNGFAQVLPRDKREVVLVLKEKFKYVVGMTGDGVNDAPALSAAQCGIAVDDATDAAKNAAAIILTSPGLSAIYSAVVESRRIFRKLKSYILYRFAATIQIVVVLSLLIFCSNCVLNSLYVILLALLNDITMLPIAYDRQQASKYPEHPDVKKLLIISTAFGVVETIISLAFAYGADRTTIFDGDLSVTDCTDKLQASVWLQMFIAAELLIFITRAPTFIFMSIRPSVALMVSALGGCLLVSILAATSSTFGKLSVKDIVLVWVYNFIFMIIVDCLKVYYYHVFNESSEVLDDKEEDEQAEEPAAPADEEAPAAPAPSDPHQSVRELSQASSLANATGSSVKSSMRSKSSIEDVISRPSVNYDTGRFVSTRSSRMGATASHFSLRGGALHTVGGSLRPNVPSLNPAKARLDHV